MTKVPKATTPKRGHLRRLGGRPGQLSSRLTGQVLPFGQLHSRLSRRLDRTSPVAPRRPSALGLYHVGEDREFFQRMARAVRRRGVRAHVVPHTSPFGTAAWGVVVDSDDYFIALRAANEYVERSNKRVERR